MRRIVCACYVALLISACSNAFGQAGFAKQTPAASNTPAKLTASDGRASNELGYSVAISGDTVVVGAPYATVAGHEAQGSAYIFRRTGQGWRQTAKLTATDGQINAFFGSSVSISGNTVVVGADGADVDSKIAQGAAYIFVQPAKGWTNMTQTAKLTATDGAAKSYFGSSVAMREDTVVIGADGANVGPSNFAGAVYVFQKPSKGWATTTRASAKLIASDAAKDDQLGYSVAISGDAVIAGARFANVGPIAHQGASYLFAKSAQGWKDTHETAKLTASDGAKDSQFGSSVSTDGKVVVAGAPGKDAAGAVYLFVKPSGRWASSSTYSAKLIPADGGPGDQLGLAVSIQGDMVLAGAPSVSATKRQSAVYGFMKPAGGWSGKLAETWELMSPGGKEKEDDRLGSCLQIEGESLVVGAPYATIGNNKYQGAAYVFKRPASSQAK